MRASLRSLLAKAFDYMCNRACVPCCMQGSGEVRALGTPYGFFQRGLPGSPVGFPVVVDVAVDASRSSELARYLVEGRYMDRRTAGSAVLVNLPLASP